MVPTKKLGEVASIKTGKLDANAANDGGRYPFYTCSREISRINEAAFDGESILIAGNGEFWVKYHEDGKFNAYQRTYVVQACDEILAKYLFFNLTIEVPKLVSQGGVIQYLRLPQLQNIEIPLPSLPEQKKIVARLERVLAKISEAKKLRAEARENADNLLPAELHKIFSDGKKKSWGEKELGEVFVLNYGKGLSRSERSEDGKYIVYGANGELGRSDKYLIEGEGIIIGRKGSAGEITRVSGRYWPTDVTYFVTEDKNYEIDFTYYLFKFLDFPQYAVGVKPGINRNQIYEIKIPLPPLAEQKRIVKHLDSLSQKLQKLQEYQKSTQSDLLTFERSILHKAFL